MTVEGIGGPARRGAYDRVSCVTLKRSNEPGLSSNIKVVVRVRPENAQERQGGHGVAVQVLDERMLVFDPNEDEVPEYYHGKQRRQRDLTRRKHKDIKFVFDRVFDQQTNNQEVYENTTRGILDGVLDGYNCSVFAYGATGAGKTFTMKGSRACPGIMFHTMMELYRRFDALRDSKTCDVAVSYLEVYNEQIRDLLVPGPYLPIREDPSRGTIVSGLSLHKPRDAKELLHMLEYGNENRTQHPTDANAESSRSHAVFQVFVRQRERTAAMSADVRVAKMSLIDLAGSERATVTTNRGQRFREGANINRSLLALGNCINALAEGKGKGYIPYRNSKLTRLLKDSLGGNCRTVMIAAVSPSTMTYDDTHNTLKYANRAKNIKADLKRNVLSVDFHVTKYVRIVEELRAEVSELKVKLDTYESGGALQPAEALANFSHQLEIERLQQTLYGVFYERLSVRKELGELEGLERDLLFRISRKQGARARLNIFADNSECAAGLERQVATMEGRKVKVVSRKAALEARMVENVSALQHVEDDIRLLAADGPVPEVLELSMRTHHLEVELRDTKRHVKHLKKLCRGQQRHALQTERLLQQLLTAYQQQQHILRGSGLLTNDLAAGWRRVQEALEGGGQREVAWADQSLHETAAATNDVTVMDAPPPHTELADFDALLDFPVLSCVKTTPKTPRGGRTEQLTRRRHSTGNPSSATPQAPPTPAIPCSPITPHTPDTHGAPRHNISASVQLTPSCAKLSGSYQLLNSSSQQQQVSLLTPCKPLMASYADTTPAEKESRLSIDGDSEVFTDMTVTIPADMVPAGLSLPVVNSEHPGETHSVCKGCDGPNSVHSQSVAGSTGAVIETSLQNGSLGCRNCERSGGNVKRKHLDGTFNVIDGIRPLDPSPTQPLPVKKLFKCEKSSNVQNLETAESQNAIHSSHNVGNQSYSSALKTLQVSYNPIQSDSNHIQRTTHTVASGTVTKCEKPPRGILKGGGTVVKNKENVAPEPEPRGSVVRAMDFTHVSGTSPAGKLTFAEVVKSPACAQRPSRSPLASRDNLPPFPAHMFDTNTRRTTFAANELDNMAPKGSLEARRQTVCASSSQVPATGSQGAERVLASSLRRLGLPSVQEASTRHAPQQHVPGYMRPTTAFRNRNHHPARPGEENVGGGLGGHTARRVAVIDSSTVTKKPKRVLQRSKSAASLHSARRGMYF